MANKDYLKLTSPRGTAVFPRLTQPDTKFDDNGIYSTGLRMSAADAKSFIQKIQEVAKAHMGKALPAKDNPCWKFVTDDDGNETGDVQFKFKVKNLMVRDRDNPGQKKMWDRRPALFDAKGRPITGSLPKVGGGSVLKVSFVVYTYDEPKPGLNLQLQAVQIIELKEWGNQDASDFGFGEEEDGYETSDDTSSGGFEDETSGAPEGSSGGDRDDF